MNKGLVKLDDQRSRLANRVPVRQFVLSLPHRFRYRLAYDHRRSVAVFGLFVRAVMGLYRRRAEARGLGNGQTGAITFVQRILRPDVIAKILAARAGP